MLNPNLAAIELSKEEVQRYSRHIILPEVGLEGKKNKKPPVFSASAPGDSVPRFYSI